MTDLNELKKQVQNIIETTKPTQILNSKEDRRIREVEKDLLEAEIKTEYNILISDLNNELAEMPLGESKFKRSEYLLSWKQWESTTFRLVLTNVPHKNSKILIKTPESFKKDISILLEKFLEKMQVEINKCE